MWEAVAAPLPEMSVQLGFQLAPPSALTRTWYPVMALSAGSVQLNLMAASPLVAVRPLGASGGSGVGSGVGS